MAREARFVDVVTSSGDDGAQRDVFGCLDNGRLASFLLWIGRQAVTEGRAGGWEAGERSESQQGW